MTQPQDAISEVVSELATHIQRGSLGEFRLRHLEREAEKLRTAEPAYAYMALGMISCLRDHPEAAEKNHENSRQLAPGDVLVLLNHAASLRALGFPSESTELLRKEGAAFDDQRVVSELKSSLLASGQLHELLALSGSDAAAEHDAIAQRAQEVLEHTETTEAGLQEALALVYQTMHEAGFYMHQLAYAIKHDESGYWVNLEVLPFQADSEDAFTLSEQLIDAMAEQDPEAFRRGAVTVQFRTLKKIAA